MQEMYVKRDRCDGRPWKLVGRTERAQGRARYSKSHGFDYGYNKSYQYLSKYHENKKLVEAKRYDKVEHRSRVGHAEHAHRHA